jgi:hypothetical protein
MSTDEINIDELVEKIWKDPYFQYLINTPDEEKQDSE